MYKQKTSNKIYLLYGAIIGIIVGLALFAFQCIRYVLSDVIEQEYTTLDVSNYGVWDGHIESEKKDINSKLAIFPASVENALDVDYYYSCGKYSSSSNYYVIYSKMSYSDENYQKELQRLSEIECDVYLGADLKTVSNKIQYSEDLFTYPAYIAIYGSNLSYEYALVNEQEKEITYIYLQRKSGNDILPKENIPLECWNQDMLDLNDWSNVNIYYAQDSNGDYAYFDGNEGIISLQ